MVGSDAQPETASAAVTQSDKTVRFVHAAECAANGKKHGSAGLKTLCMVAIGLIVCVEPDSGIEIGDNSLKFLWHFFDTLRTTPSLANNCGLGTLSDDTYAVCVRYRTEYVFQPS